MFFVFIAFSGARAGVTATVFDSVTCFSWQENNIKPDYQIIQSFRLQGVMVPPPLIGVEIQQSAPPMMFEKSSGLESNAGHKAMVYVDHLLWMRKRFRQEGGERGVHGG
ncbi:MAG TPA: hypothetical protein PLG22_05980 [Kiritimatiellia bacterium]|nr:hypothetical protein [Kiritimatiellia bacterium]